MEDQIEEVSEKSKRLPPDGDTRGAAYDFKEGRYHIPLKYPFEFGERQVKVIKIRRPTTKVMRNLSANMKMGEFIKMIETLGDEPKSLVDRIDPYDTGEICDFLGVFF